MKQSTEKFTIEVTEVGVVITSDGGNRVQFRASEALMLLDILKNEEAELRKMSQEASPMPLKINLK